MSHEQKVRRFSTALLEYTKPLENTNFYPVVNTEVIDTAEIIASGAYKEEAYRQNALALARELHDATKAFLDNHQQV